MNSELFLTLFLALVAYRFAMPIIDLLNPFYRGSRSARGGVSAAGTRVSFEERERIPDARGGEKIFFTKSR